MLKDIRLGEIKLEKDSKLRPHFKSCFPTLTTKGPLKIVSCPEYWVLRFCACLRNVKYNIPKFYSCQVKKKNLLIEIQSHNRIPNGSLMRWMRSQCKLTKDKRAHPCRSFQVICFKNEMITNDQFS